MLCILIFFEITCYTLCFLLQAVQLPKKITQATTIQLLQGLNKWLSLIIYLYSIFTISVGDSCEFGSAKYFAICGLGGILSCGITHTALVPLDLVKCRIQVCEFKSEI